MEKSFLELLRRLSKEPANQSRIIVELGNILKYYDLGSDVLKEGLDIIYSTIRPKANVIPSLWYELGVRILVTQRVGGEVLESIKKVSPDYSDYWEDWYNRNPRLPGNVPKFCEILENKGFEVEGDIVSLYYFDKSLKQTEGSDIFSVEVNPRLENYRLISKYKSDLKDGFIVRIKVRVGDIKYLEYRLPYSFPVYLRKDVIINTETSLLWRKNK